MNIMAQKSKDPNHRRGISELFIQRPITTTLVMVGIVLFGMIGYAALPVSDLPTVDYPTINVNASLPGANPETMAASVATPLERQFSGIAGIDSINSSNSQGSTSITLQFNLSRNIDAAAQDVQTAISASLPQLPPGMPNPPSLRKSNPSDSPILFFALNSDVLSLPQIDEYAETLIAQRISMVDGVSQVQVYGAMKYAVRAQMDPNALADRGIGVDDIDTAIRNANPNTPTGTLYGKYTNMTVQTNVQLDNAAQFRNLIVAYRNGSPVPLEEVATVIDSVENNKVASWFNGRRSVTMAVQRQPGTNTVKVVDDIKALIPQFKQQLPASVNLDTLNDRSISIRQSVDDVQFSLVLAMGLVVMVIFLFLRNVRATIIPTLALPTSIVGTFAVMYLLNFSLDNLSLMALTLSVGFVVDDAVVMLENIVRRIETGDSVKEAALNGSREIGFTIVSMTVSLVAVFIPVLFMGGILGRLFREFAITISVAILVSGIVSLTLTPMLASKLLKAKDIRASALHEDSGKPVRRRGWWGFTEGFYNRELQFYEWTLRGVLRHPLFTVAISLILAVFTFYLFGAVPKGFIPSGDTGLVLGSTEGAQGISLDDMIKHQNAITEVIKKDPNVQSYASTVGAGGRNSGGNSGTIFIGLKPLGQRKLAAAHNVTIAQIQTALGDAFGSRQVSTIYTPTNEYQVILEARPEFQSDPSALGRLYIHASNGSLVPLSAVASFSKSVGPAQVNHFGEMPATTISFNLRPGVSLSQATTQIQNVAKQSLPATITTT